MISQIAKGYATFQTARQFSIHVGSLWLWVKIKQWLHQLVICEIVWKMTDSENVNSCISIFLWILWKEKSLYLLKNLGSGIMLGNFHKSYNLLYLESLLWNALLSPFFFFNQRDMQNPAARLWQTEESNVYFSDFKMWNY